MTTTTETFHVFCRIRTSGQHRINIMAEDHADARRKAEAEGHEVIKVRRAPTPPADNLYRAGKRGSR